MTLFQLIVTGGFTIIILILFSLVSLAIIVERSRYYHRRSRMSRADFMTGIRQEVEHGDPTHALRVCETTDAPFSAVARAGLSSFVRGSFGEIAGSMDRAIIVETSVLERHTAIVGTIGSTAVYIGLFGTVLGIIRAFMGISEAGTGGINIISRGISESLVTTAAGLIVAIPAVMAYTYFMKRVADFVTDMELCASEITDLTAVHHGQKTKD